MGGIRRLQIDRRISSKDGFGTTNGEGIFQYDVTHELAARWFTLAREMFDRFEGFSADSHAVDEQQTLWQVGVFGDPRSKLVGTHTIVEEFVSSFTGGTFDRTA